MKVTLSDERPPSHWQRIKQLIESDAHLRKDVALVVNQGSARIVDTAGLPLGTDLPRDLAEAELATRDGQLRLIVWLWWNFDESGSADQRERRESLVLPT
jgi:hypothetical protein